jgi:hypothetical protein
MPKASPGRPKTPKDVADAQALSRIATLASQIMVSLRQPDHEIYDSERQLRGWLTEAGIQHSTSDIGPALTLLESTGRIQRPEVRPNTQRPGWIVTAATEAAERRMSVNGNGTTPTQALVEDAPVPEAVADATEPLEPAEDATESAEPVEVDPTAVDALARDILKAVNAPDRGYQGNPYLIESDTQLRQYLTEDGVSFDDAHLAAALSRLETATLPGSDARLILGAELHRRNGSRNSPAAHLPGRAMMIESIHPFDTLFYEPAEIFPYLV